MVNANSTVMHSGKVTVQSAEKSSLEPLKVSRASATVTHPLPTKGVYPPCRELYYISHVSALVQLCSYFSLAKAANWATARLTVAVAVSLDLKKKDVSRQKRNQKA